MARFSPFLLIALGGLLLLQMVCCVKIHHEGQEWSPSDVLKDVESGCSSSQKKALLLQVSRLLATYESCSGGIDASVFRRKRAPEPLWIIE